MRPVVIFDTNILVAALVVRTSPPARLYEAWKEGRLRLVTSEMQVEEFPAGILLAYSSFRLDE